MHLRSQQIIAYIMFGILAAARPAYANGVPSDVLCVIVSVIVGAAALLYLIVNRWKNPKWSGYAGTALLLAVFTILFNISDYNHWKNMGEKRIRASMSSDARNAATALEAVYFDCQIYPAVNVAPGSHQALVLNTLGGKCAKLPASNTVIFSSSTGNAISVKVAKDSYTITVANPGAGKDNGKEYSPLTVTGGTDQPPSGTWANGALW